MKGGPGALVSRGDLWTPMMPCITILRFFALSINALLIFDMCNLNGALLLNTASFSALSFSFAAEAKKSIVSFTTKYVSL